MAMDHRPDPLKVFIGCLSMGINKPMVEELLGSHGFPMTIYVPPVPPGKMGIAFCTFATPQQAEAAVSALHQLSSKYSPTRITAVIGDTYVGSLLSSRL